MNVRFPGDETKLSYLWPSLDVTLLFGAFALVGARRGSTPSWLRPLLVGLFCLVRLVRFGDGVRQNYFHRPFNAYLDLPLAPELVRLLWSTSRHSVFWLGLVACVGAAVAFVFAVAWGLREGEGFLRDARGRTIFLGVVLALVVLTPFGPRAHGDEEFVGAFAGSVGPRFAREVDFLLHVSGYRSEKLAEVRAAAERTRNADASLERLKSASVLVFLVESYGATVFDPKLASPETDEALARFEQSLRRDGYSLATGLLDSPVYGGSSWLAQATLATAVQTADEFQFSLLKAEEPPTIADAFRRAGYRTVLVQPGTTRAFPERDFLHFEARYAAFDLGYRGPNFGWAPMPDQFVLDVIHRRELTAPARPVLIEYALVSSHAPWSDQPAVVEWDTLGDGAIFQTVPRVRFDTRLVGSAVREAYLASIRYDFEVLSQYLTERLSSSPLVFVIGDHQPIPNATGH
ncbi:MAG TPA: sulfatase-like hydrolase/transferase, partial [Polyangiaceae bacterium]|nr:sulfatase-like hydrolase/transferase [Polyangiaceae bacterium]